MVTPRNALTCRDGRIADHDQDHPREAAAGLAYLRDCDGRHVTLRGATWRVPG